MTPAHLYTLRTMLTDPTLRPSEQDAIKALLEVREEVVAIACPLAHSGTNPATHGVLCRILKAVGER